MIPLFKVAMSDSAAGRVVETLTSGFIGQGPRVDEFEAELRRCIKNQFVLTTNSCTSALHLGLHLLKKPGEHRGNSLKWAGLMPGDEVLTTPLTCAATNWPILANGLRIKWVDVDPGDLNLDIVDLTRKLSAKTKVILLVHWGGYPADLDRVRAVQQAAEEQYGFRPAVIEDCAHSWGSTYKGLPLGNHGNICAFSFQAIKHLTCGDGGALVFPEEHVYARAKLLRWYGIDREGYQKSFRCGSDIAEWGFKFHMNDISAAIGLENLKIVDGVVARHRENADFYSRQLRDVPGVRLLDYQADRESSCWIYTIKVQRRDEFMRRMEQAGIMVSRVHERNDIHSCVQEYASRLPLLDAIVKEMVCIPCGWWVDDEQREYIVDTIARGW